MSVYTDNTTEMMMALNSFGPRFGPQSIPSYDNWVANNSFDPFGPEPFAPTSYTPPGIPLHVHTKGESRMEEGLDVGSRVGRGHGSSEADMTRNFPQERSRFAFAQKRIERTTNASVSQISSAHSRHSVCRSGTPAPITAAPATVPRVVGPRPLRSQRVFHARREPTLVAPKAVHPLPAWLTRFKDHEEELVAEFCSPKEDFSPSTPTLPTTAGAQLPSDHVLECPPPSTTPLLGFADSDSDYTDIGIEVGEWCLKEDEDFGEGDEDYDLFEFDVDSDFGSDGLSFRSEPSSSASYHVVDAFGWPTPYQGRIADGEASGPHASPFNPCDLGTTQSPNTLPWSAFTDPFTGAPITVSPCDPPSRLSLPIISRMTSKLGWIGSFLRWKRG